MLDVKVQQKNTRSEGGMSIRWSSRYVKRPATKRRHSSRTHQRHHEIRFECKDCGKAFSRGYQLSQHQRKSILVRNTYEDVKNVGRPSVGAINLLNIKNSYWGEAYECKRRGKAFDGAQASLFIRGFMLVEKPYECKTLWKASAWWWAHGTRDSTLGRKTTNAKLWEDL